jgi:hypothetical protein
MMRVPGPTIKKAIAAPTLSFALETDQLQAAAIELLGEFFVVCVRIWRRHGPSPGPVFSIGIEDAVLAVVLAAVIGCVVIQKTVIGSYCLRPFGG